MSQLTGITDHLDPTRSLAMEYDPLGNLAREMAPSGAERRFQHDAFNQLRRVSVFTPAAGGGNPVEATIGLYDYDFEGRRIHRVTADEELYYVYNGLNVTNEYDRWGQLAAGYDFGLPGGFAVQARWQLLGNRLHSGTGSGGAWTPDFGAPGDLVRANFAGEGERFYFHDALGSTTMLGSLAPPPGGGLSVWAVGARYDYDPWGSQLTPAQPSSNRVHFTTYRHDAESGLEYAMARYYQSSVGRFTQVDPLQSVGWQWDDRPQLFPETRGFSAKADIRSTGGQESYSTESGGLLVGFGKYTAYGYARNNPFQYIDPDGSDERHALGRLGEKIAKWRLRRDGYTIVLEGARKAVTKGGFDIVAKKGTEVLLIDNKAFFCRKTVSSATALVENLAPNLRSVLEELEEKLASEGLGAAERKVIEETSTAILKADYKLVITGAGGTAERVGLKLAAKGITFKFLGKFIGKSTVLLGIVTELYFIDSTGGFLADVPLDPEEEALFRRWEQGEDLSHLTGDENDW